MQSKHDGYTHVIILYFEFKKDVLVVIEGQSCSLKISDSFESFCNHSRALMEGPTVIHRSALALLKFPVLSVSCVECAIKHSAIVLMFKQI